MKISVVCFTGNTGLTHYSASLARALAGHHDVEFITATDYELQEFTKNIRLTTLFRRTRHYPVDIFRFVRHILHSRPDVVLIQSWLKYPALEGTIVGLFGLFGIHTALTIHDVLPHYPRPWSRWLHAWFYRRFDRLIVHSERAASDLKALGVDTPCLVVPHGAYDIFNTLGLSRSEARKAFPTIAEKDFVVLFFGFLGERKGIMEFLDVADRLAGQGSVKFMVAGKPESKAFIRAALDKLRDRPNLIIHDRSIPFAEVQHYFSACDLVALPYTEGSTSGVLKLAMAFSKPVLWTDVGDFPEAMKSWTGVQVDKNRLHHDLGEKVLWAHEHSLELLEKISGLAEEFSWMAIAGRYSKFLTEDDHG
ncbi:MAG: glycosyltransferase family 4 protein [Thiobacillus sp.]|nr:glycosyltransferase family 4 protein [Thiobacillus sp.]